MTASLETSIARQRTALLNMLEEPLSFLAARCAEVWPDRSALDRVLAAGLPTVPHCGFLYVLDAGGVQISDNIAAEGVVEKDFGRDRSERPYMGRKIPQTGLLLSDAYISLRAQRPSLTAVMRIAAGNRHLGYLGADFDLRALPLTRQLYREPSHWQQLKGDPAIRGSLFQQQRIDSIMDRNIDLVLAVMDELVTQSGVFHAKLHFSSSRATIWLVADPYCYRILGYEALVNPDICLAYPHHPYPEKAVVPPEAVRPILDAFRRLRFSDEVIYLRSGSLNVFNGMVGLNFSCDGSHYLRYDELLREDSPFWRSSGA
jgi:hypothetical protein